MRHAFFSFDYRDVWTTNVVRNSWVTQDPQAAGFLDKSLWEESKQKSDAAIKMLIDGALQGTSVTVVLIGPRTASRRFVRYEMEQSLARGNGFVAVHVGGIKDARGRTRRRGKNPLHSLFDMRDGTRVRLSDIYQTYDWIPPCSRSARRRRVRQNPSASMASAAALASAPSWSRR